MREEVLYVPNDYAENLISNYTGQHRKKLIEELNGTLRKLKFYTNNDFAFKDVHNEELFLQNGKVLVETVQLLQPYRIVGTQDIQFLGDLFEQLLNQGFKQNEGQFFTPVPITRFIWKSLPLDSIVQDEAGAVHYPRVIDYACGAGHFLTEGFEEISDAACQYDPTIEDDLGDATGSETISSASRRTIDSLAFPRSRSTCMAQGRATWSSATDLKIIPTRNRQPNRQGTLRHSCRQSPVLCRGLQTASQASQQRTQSAGNHQR